MLEVDNLLKILDLNQKSNLLSGASSWETQTVNEHSIPSLRASDGPNGIRGSRIFQPTPSACSPCGTGLGATFDPQLLKRLGQLLAKEAKAKGVHIILGPTVNIQRSPLGGRGFESFSEDPVLSGNCATAIINGIQEQGIQATIKHFVCNDQEHERRSVSADVSERALREIYLRPFQIAIRDSDPVWIMTSYNKVNGVHMSHHPMLQSILRQEWAWKGAIMSDWYGVYTCADSIRAGLDLEMPGKTIWRGDLIPHSIDSGELKTYEVDNCVKNILNVVNKAMKESGVPENAEEGNNDNAETTKFLREIAGDSLVLLKNERNILPFSKTKKTAVIGPNGLITSFCGGGSASLFPYRAISVLEGISSKCKSKVDYVHGPNVFNMVPQLNNIKTTSNKNGFSAKIFDLPENDTNRKLIDSIDLVHTLAIMEDYIPPNDGDTFYGELEGYLNIETSGVFDLSITVIGTADLYIDDTLLINNSSNQKPGSFFFNLCTIEKKASLYLEANHTYKVVIKFGSAKTSNVTTKPDALKLKCLIRFGCSPCYVFESELEKAITVAQSAEQVALVVGLNKDIESEGFDRSTMDLPEGTNELISGVLSVNSNTVVVINSGTPVTMPWINETNAVLQVWYGGNEGGNAIADVIFGDVTPSGKLPLSIPKRVEDNPSFLNFKSDKGHTIYGEGVYVGYRFYEKTKKDVLFPFGHGLSYTFFQYSELSIKNNSTEVIVSMKVTNEGNFSGKEVVQVYFSQVNPSVERPVKELASFSKTKLLEPGESQSMSLNISRKYGTSFWDEYKHSWVSEAGTYKVYIGSSSSDLRWEGEFNVTLTEYWTGL